MGRRGNAWHTEGRQYIHLVSLLSSLNADLLHRGCLCVLGSVQSIDRTKAIVGNVNARFVLTSPTYRRTFEDSEAKTVVVDDSFALERSVSSITSVYVSPHSPAFVLFTSGSTGQPKGVVQEHASVCTISKAYGETLHVDHNSRVLQFARYVIRRQICCMSRRRGI